MLWLHSGAGGGISPFPTAESMGKGCLTYGFREAEPEIRIHIQLILLGKGWELGSGEDGWGSRKRLKKNVAYGKGWHLCDSTQWDQEAHLCVTMLVRHWLKPGADGDGGGRQLCLAAGTSLENVVAVICYQPTHTAARDGCLGQLRVWPGPHQCLHQGAPERYNYREVKRKLLRHSTDVLFT